MADTVSDIAGAVSGKTYDFSLNLILPVGISFYTFQTLSYAIDIYRGDIKAERKSIYDDIAALSDFGLPLSTSSALKTLFIPSTVC